MFNTSLEKKDVIQNVNDWRIESSNPDIRKNRTCCGCNRTITGVKQTTGHIAEYSEASINR